MANSLQASVAYCTLTGRLYGTPWNRNIRGMTRRRIRWLYPRFAMAFEPITMLAQLARRQGPFAQPAYSLLAASHCCGPTTLGCRQRGTQGRIHRKRKSAGSTNVDAPERALAATLRKQKRKSFRRKGLQPPRQSAVNHLRRRCAADQCEGT